MLEILVWNFTSRGFDILKELFIRLVIVTDQEFSTFIFNPDRKGDITFKRKFMDCFIY